MAEVALKAGIKASTISTDIYSRNRINGPVYNFAHTLEKLRLVGYSWSEIIEKVTAAPSKVLKLQGKGLLKAGYDADLTVFKLYSGNRKLTDSNGNERQATELIQPIKTIVGEKQYDIDLRKI